MGSQKLGPIPEGFLFFDGFPKLPPNVNPSRDKHSLVNSPKAATLLKGEFSTCDMHTIPDPHPPHFHSRTNVEMF